MVLVTGATGGLGRSVVPRLLEQGLCVRLSSTSKKALEKTFGPEEKGRKEYLEFDLEKEPQSRFEKLVCGADEVIHLAGQMTRYLPASDARGAPSRIVRINFRATKLLAQAAKKAGVKRIVFSSSCSVYGKIHDCVADGMNAAPFEAYGLSKLLAEQAVQESGASHAILRIARIYGKNFPSQFAAELDALKKQELVLPGFGRGIIPLVHQDDAVRAIILALCSKKIGVADVGGPEKISCKDFYKLIARRLNVAGPKTIGGKILESCALSNKKARELFGWKPKERLRNHLDEICFPKAGLLH